jgi:hypothetical protein
MPRRDRHHHERRPVQDKHFILRTLLSLGEPLRDRLGPSDHSERVLSAELRSQHRRAESGLDDGSLLPQRQELDSGLRHSRDIAGRAA